MKLKTTKRQTFICVAMLLITWGCATGSNTSTDDQASGGEQGSGGMGGQGGSGGGAQAGGAAGSGGARTTQSAGTGGGAGQSTAADAGLGGRSSPQDAGPRNDANAGAGGLANTGGSSGGGGTPGKLTGTIRIVQIGDSLTQGSVGNDQVAKEVSWRYPFWKKLVDAGYPFEMQGTLTKGFIGDNPNWVSYKGKPFPRNHESVWGISTKDQLRGDPSPDDPGGNGPLPPLGERIKAYSFDLAIVLLGSNASGKQSEADKVTDMGQLIDVLRGKNPNVIVILGKAHNTSEAYRQGQDQLAKTKSTVVSPVIIADVNSGFDPDVDTLDGAHTAPSGDEKIATGMFNAVSKLVAQTK